MTTIVKRIALLAALAVVVVTARAQFGSYSHDLPFMGVDASSTSYPIPSTGLVLWHKPDSLSGTNGQRVIVWQDSGPYGIYDAKTNTAIVGGSLTNDAVGSYEAVRLSGTGAYVYHTNGTSHDILRNKDGGTLFTLWRPFNVGSYSGAFYISQGDADNVSRFSLSIFNTSVRLYASSLDADSESSMQYSLINGWHLATYVVNYTNRIGSMYTNGVLRASDSLFTSGNKSSDTTSRVLYLGTDGSSSFGGYFAEVVFYNYPLGTNELSQVHTYFKNKYSLW